MNAKRTKPDIDKVLADGRLIVDLGYVTSRPPRDRGFKPALEEELDRMRAFLAVNRPAAP